MTFSLPTFLTCLSFFASIVSLTVATMLLTPTTSPGQTMVVLSEDVNSVDRGSSAGSGDSFGDMTADQVMQVSACLLRCKDEHMMKMDNEWSMDFAFPLLSLLRSNGSVDAAKAKAYTICEDNSLLDECFLNCNASMERKILRIGLKPWTELCMRLDLLQTQFQCWRNNIDTLLLGCHLESHRLRQSMEILTHNHSILIVDDVCKAMNVLSICNIEEYAKHCGDVTRMLLIRLFRTSRTSVTDMLRIKWPVLPDACTQRIEYYEEEEHQLALLSRDGRPSPPSITTIFGFFSFVQILFFIFGINFNLLIE